MTNELVINELHFDAAHYLDKDFGKCQNLHGHRWYVKELLVTTEKIVDFNVIKVTIDSFDHCLIIPFSHLGFWKEVVNLAEQKNMPFKIRIVPIKDELVLVENLKKAIKTALLSLDGVKDVAFTLYEGDNYGTLSEELE